MSQANVEIVEGIVEGWAVGDFGAGLADLDPEVVFVVRHPFPERAETTGADGIERYMRRFLDNWASYAVEARDLQATGDVVLVDAVQRGEGKASGIEMEQGFFMLFTFRSGKVVRIESILERDDALEAAGLSE